jgi:hypothetical protein
MHRLLAVMNGTGELFYNDTAYDHAMRHSFCRQMYDSHAFDHASKFYVRGPGGDGFSTLHRSHALRDWVLKTHARSRAGPIYLAGYSRGAWAVTMAAEALKAHGVHIDAMFLFDPVKMQGYPWGTVVPTNVRRVYIARRWYDNPVMDKYDWSATVWSGSDNPVRKWWGVTSLNTHRIPGDEKRFLGSHGALGGVGWTHVTEDWSAHGAKGCQAQVAKFMNAALKHEKLDIVLRNYHPESHPDGLKSLF